jgi:hypothetical protein
VAYYNGSVWTQVGGTVDTTAHTITVSVTHFSIWAVVAEALPTATASPTSTPSTLPIGAIAFTGFGSDADQFSFVALRDLPAGTSICFTNAGYDSPSGPFDNTDFEGDNAEYLTFTASALIAAGNQVVINGHSSQATLNLGAVQAGSVSIYAVGGTTLGLKAKGDQLFAFQGTSLTPSLIAGINVIGEDNTSGWLTSGTEIKQTSYLPSVLASGGAVDVGGNYDSTGTIGTNAVYNCSAGTTGSPSQLLTDLDNPNNWLTSASVANLPITGTAATLTLCGSFNPGGAPGTPTNTPVPTPTGLVFASKPLLGPVPQHSGQPVILGLPKPAAHSEWWVYSLNFKLVSTLTFGEEKASWSTSGIAAGVYRVKCKVTYLDGSSYEGWQTVALVP